MLDTVKQELNNLPFISFEQYFTQYVLDVQDKNINEEFNFLINNNFLDCRSVDRLLASML